MKDQRGFGFLPIIVIIAVIAMVGSGGYMWWQKNGYSKMDYVLYAPTPTAKASASATPVVAADPYVGWKIYTGARDGYSLKYPGDWQGVFPANYDGKNDGTRYEFTSPDYVEGETIVQTPVAKGARVDISVASTTNTISSYGQSAAGIENLHNLTVAGQPAVQWDVEGYEGVYHTQTVVIKTGNEYDLTLVYPQGDKSRYLSVYQQMLESLTLP